MSYPLGLTSSGCKMYPFAMDHSAVINLWPSLSLFAADLGVQYGTAKAMRRRGKIPPEYWVRLCARARERGIEGVTVEQLAVAVSLEVIE